ncbi:MAG: hypothetical protein R3C40_12330 [Parvularculaceae bacterium]
MAIEREAVQVKSILTFFGALALLAVARLSAGSLPGARRLAPGPLAEDAVVMLEAGSVSSIADKLADVGAGQISAPSSPQCG